MSEYGQTQVEFIKRRLEELVPRARSQTGLDDPALRALVKEWRERLPSQRERLTTVDAALADLAGWLGIRRGGVGRALGWAADHYAAVLTLLGLIATAFFGLAYIRFYKEVGISPEEAGLSQTQILTRSAVGGFALLLTLSVGFLLFIAPFIPLITERNGSERSTGTGKEFLGVVGLSILAVAVIVIFMLAIKGTFSFFPMGVVAAYYVLIPLAVGLKFNPRSDGPLVAVRPLRFRMEDFVGAYLAVLPTALLMMFIVFTGKAADEGRRAADGQAVRQSEFMGLPFLGVRAEPTFVTWRTTAPEGFALPNCVLYLGRQSGSAVLYDSVYGRTLQVPEGDVLLATRHERSSCQAPINTLPPKVRLVGGARYKCSPGKWRGGPRPEFAYQWTLNGERLPEEESSSFLADSYVADQLVRCRVEAKSDLGTDVAYSKPVVPHVNAQPARRPPGAVHGEL